MNVNIFLTARWSQVILDIRPGTMSSGRALTPCSVPASSRAILTYPSRSLMGRQRSPADPARPGLDKIRHGRILPTSFAAVSMPRNNIVARSGRRENSGERVRLVAGGKRGSPQHLGQCGRWRQHPNGLKLFPELVRRAELDCLHPYVAGSFEVLLHVVNHQRRIRCQAETVE